MRDVGNGDAFLAAVFVVYPFVAGGFEADGFEVRDTVDERVIEPPAYYVGVKSNYSLSLSLSLSDGWAVSAEKSVV